MRGCLSILLLAAVFLVAGSWLAGPPAAGLALETALTVAGFRASSLDAEVTTDPPFEVLGGHADRLDLRATDATFGGIRAGQVELTLLDVDLVGRRFATISGTLGSLVIPGEDGPIPVQQAELDGPAAAVAVVITVDGDEVERRATDAVRAGTGLVVGAATLVAPDRLEFGALGIGVGGRLVVDAGGALGVRLEVPGSPVVRILDPEEIRLDGARVADGDLVLEGVVDLARLLGG